MSNSLNLLRRNYIILYDLIDQIYTKKNINFDKKSLLFITSAYKNVVLRDLSKIDNKTYDGPTEIKNTLPVDFENYTFIDLYSLWKMYILSSREKCGGISLSEMTKIYSVFDEIENCISKIF